MNFAGSRRSAALGLALAGLALAAWTPAASAAPRLSPASAITPAGATPSSTPPPSMTLEFTSKIAEVAGPGALVRVKCSGVESRSCVGTLAIQAPGEPPEVAYSIDRGEERVVVVPLGPQRTIFDGIVAVKTRVVAQTVQPSGGSVRTASTLRFK